MLKVKCLNKLRDKNNKIYGYTIQDEVGNQRTVQADALKNAIRTGQVKCINLHLTDNNRLIDCSSPEVMNSADIESRIKPADKKPTKAKVMSKANIPSIFGISLKSVKTLHGREGAYYCGTVYKNGKKLGDWSQSSYGAIVDDFYFNEHELDEAVKSWGQNSKYGGSINRESFMIALVVLGEYYTIYNKAIKKGRNCVVIVTDEYDMSYHVIECSVYGINNGLPADVNDLITKGKKSIMKSGYTPIVKVFKSPEDFIIQ